MGVAPFTHAKPGSNCAFKFARVNVGVNVVPIAECPGNIHNACPTVKLTSKLSDMPLAPDTVTVAVYVPTASPVLGTTVKFALPLTAMLLILVVDSVKLPAFVPDNVAVNSPVLFTITISGVCAALL